MDLIVNHRMRNIYSHTLSLKGRHPDPMVVVVRTVGEEIEVVIVVVTAAAVVVIADATVVV